MNLNNRIFYNDLPHWDSGQNVGRIKWIGLNNYPLRFSYNGYIDFCYISYIKDNNKRKIVISYCGNVLTRNSNSFNKITPEDEEFKQSKDRIHRIGQDNKCTYIILQANNSIEEKIYDCVQRKRNAVDELYLEMGLRNAS